MENTKAPNGQIYLCVVCGCRSRDKLGNDAIGNKWDACCINNSTLVYENCEVIHRKETIYNYKSPSGITISIRDNASSRS